MVPCKSADEFEWSHHRILLTLEKGRKLERYYVFVIESGSEGLIKYGLYVTLKLHS